MYFLFNCKISIVNIYIHGVIACTHWLQAFFRVWSEYGLLQTPTIVLLETKHIVPDKNLFGNSNFASDAFNVVIQLATQVPGSQSRVTKQEAKIDAIIKDSYNLGSNSDNNINDANDNEQIKNEHVHVDSNSNVNVNDNQIGVIHGTNGRSPDGEREHDDCDDDDDEYEGDDDINGNTTRGDFGAGSEIAKASKENIDALEIEKVYHVQLKHQGTNNMSEGQASVIL